MQYEGGIKSFVEWLNREKTPIHDEIIYVEAKKDDTEVEIAMQYTSAYTENLVSFANDIHTTEGGTHETGFKSALTKVFQRLCAKA
ncbi:MAG: hypothetical protein L6V93_19160 [Clostridiales bacterium]|nr:MAG: hypothetical protein L6V93_19160 [Clostridiales bacterium]